MGIEAVAATSTDYDVMVAREQEFYHGERPSASIPSIFTYWAVNYLSPRFREMFGTVSIEEFYANEIERVAPAGHLSVVSLGSGEASTEIEIAKILIDRGRTVRFFGTDISQAMSDAGVANAARNGVSDCFTFLTGDVNRQFPTCDATIVIANHSLHHFVELEYILNNVKQQIGEHGAFITNDMIGRNGHQRWPEVLAYTRAFWRLLPIEKRVDRIHGIIRPEYVDFDCANGTFEGIRAQDILPLCVERFHFDRFLGAGGIPDTFTDRMYGGNFSPDQPFDTAFIDAVDLVNTNLLLSGGIKPTIMFATMRNRASDGVFWPSAPADAVRTPNS